MADVTVEQQLEVAEVRLRELKIVHVPRFKGVHGPRRVGAGCGGHLGTGVKDEDALSFEGAAEHLQAGVLGERTQGLVAAAERRTCESDEFSGENNVDRRWRHGCWS